MGRYPTASEIRARLADPIRGDVRSPLCVSGAKCPPERSSRRLRPRPGRARVRARSAARPCRRAWRGGPLAVVIMHVSRAARRVAVHMCMITGGTVFRQPLWPLELRRQGDCVGKSECVNKGKFAVETGGESRPGDDPDHPGREHPGVRQGPERRAVASARQRRGQRARTGHGRQSPLTCSKVDNCDETLTDPVPITQRGVTFRILTRPATDSISASR
jgi:hypothetical protein